MSATIAIFFVFVFLVVVDSNLRFFIDTTNKVQVKVYAFCFFKYLTKPSEVARKN